MSDEEQVETEERAEDESGLSLRELFLRGGLLGAGAAFLGSPAAALAAAGRGSSAEAASLRIAVITHGAGDAFWSVAKKGAVKAGKDLGVGVLYSESRNDPQRQAQLITSAVSKKVKGIAVSAPNPSAIKDALARAKRAKIPVITLNSGVDKYKQLGALTHVGQTETIAGQAAGARLKASGGKNLPVVFHYLYDYNLNTVGGGQPVLTGPGFVDKTNAARVAAYARRGTR